jgi:hypothetical protein
MNAEQHTSLGIYDSVATSGRNCPVVDNEIETAARQLYVKAYDALKDADFMAVHSGLSKNSFICMVL